MYVVIAYRWGNTHGHHYMVYAGPDRTKAIALGATETNDRGGKYGCAVYEFDADGVDYQRIAYTASLYGEDEPDENRRIGMLTTLGLAMEQAVMSGTRDRVVHYPEKSPNGHTMKVIKSAKAQVPRWMKVAVTKAQQRYEMVEKLHAEAKQKQQASKE